MDGAIGPSLCCLAQINPPRNGIGEPAHDSIAVLRLNAAHCFDHHLLVRTDDRHEMDGVSETILALQRLIAAGNAHAPIGRAVALVSGRREAKGLNAVGNRFGVAVAGNVTDADQHGPILSVKWYAAEISEPSRLLRAMKSARNSCSPD